MCCFAGITPRGGWFRPAPLQVTDTEIFARHDGADQLLAYSLRLSTATDVAMILPIPVIPGGDEAAVRFLDLQGYLDVFQDLAHCWDAPRTAPACRSRRSVPTSSKHLVVHTLGTFEASYLPTMADFGRLDVRFRLADDVWAALPQYRDYGFVVCRLSAGADRRIHPIAFRFPTRDPARLFFPTVHVHDGHFHERAFFDHTLYFQGSSEGVPGRVLAGVCVELARTHGLVTDAPLHKTGLRGNLHNQDIWI